jgi:glycerol-3-phosphate dehydrogenase (NAD(P)+)
MEKRITIIGAGMFGYALASVYGKMYPDKEIFLYDIDENVISSLRETNRHPIFFRDKELPSNVKPTLNLEEAVSGADIILMAVPAQIMRRATSSLKPFIKKDVIIVDLAKALELGTGKRMSEVIKEELDGLGVRISAFAGGMLAGDVINEKHVCAEVAAEDEETASELARILSAPSIRLYANTDLIGLELAGSLKNVVAIAAGMFDGLFGASESAVSSKSGLVSRASMEARRLALAMGAKEHTFGPGSQAWFGDLMTTCFGDGRNRLFGEMVAKLGSAEKALAEMKKQNKLVEGYATTKVIHGMCKEKGIEAPIFSAVYSVLYGGKNPEEAVRELMSAPPKSVYE